MKIQEEPPYGECIHADQEINKQKSFFADRFSYSPYACEFTFDQVMAIYTYGTCVDVPMMPCNPYNLTFMLGFPLEFTGHRRHMDLSDEEKIYLYSAKHFQEMCPSSCNDTSYDVMKSMAILPSERTDK